MDFKVTVHKNYNDEISIESNTIPEEGNRGITKIGDDHYLIILKRSKKSCFVGIYLATKFYIIFYFFRYKEIAFLGALTLLIGFLTCYEKTQ